MYTVLNSLYYDEACIYSEAGPHPCDFFARAHRFSVNTEADDEPFEYLILCQIWPARDLNSRPPT